MAAIIWRGLGEKWEKKGAHEFHACVDSDAGDGGVCMGCCGKGLVEGEDVEEGEVVSVEDNDGIAGGIEKKGGEEV